MIMVMNTALSDKYNSDDLYYKNLIRKFDVDLLDQNIYQSYKINSKCSFFKKFHSKDESIKTIKNILRFKINYGQIYKYFTKEV